MRNEKINSLFFELLERWYMAELSLAQEWETGKENYAEQAEYEYKEYKKKYEELN